MPDATNSISNEGASAPEAGSLGDPTGRPVGTALRWFMILYLVGVTLGLIAILANLWPRTSGSSNPSIDSEVQLFALVLLAGALGSMVHALRSLYWYIGNRQLVRSWVAMYFLKPFVGAVLGLIFYLVVRGGLFPNISAQQTSPFGFAAVAALVGLFSEQAILKLKELAENLFSPAEKGENHVAPKDDDQP